MSKNDKKKKNKVKYVDDGRTIADMSSVYGGRRYGEKRQKSSLKEILSTYFSAVKMMIVPMFIALGALCLIFGIGYLLLVLGS